MEKRLEGNSGKGKYETKIYRYILQSAFSKIYLLLKEDDGDDESSVNGRRFICP